MDKRKFLKLTGLGSFGLVGAGLEPSHALEKKGSDHSKIRQTSTNPHKQKFNMSGYAAPKIDTVRIGYIGLGNRGGGAIQRIVFLENVEVKALCDIRPEKADNAKKKFEGTGHNPTIYSGSEDAWKKVCERDDIDLIYICTPWNLHASMALYAMEHGKHVACEIPVAITVDECWKLVETSERTKKHCMMLENCCYDFFELLTLNMARQGFFGEIVHVEGAYIHDIYDSFFDKTTRYNLWRLRENERNGNLYPTHGLGPVAQVLDINRGDKMDYLVSMASNDFMLAERAYKLAKEDPDFKEFAGKSFRGNMNTTTIRTHKGKTIMIQHDVSSPRPYSRIHLISGTKGAAQKYPLPGRISQGHEWFSEEEYKALEKKYEPEIVKRIGELAQKVGGHGGMDFLMDWRLIDCLRNGLALDQDVYDAASWSVISPLTEWSVANRSAPIDIPDFTSGSWKTNKPVDISLTAGGNTKVKSQ
ncbi:Gfo/Idh/MocA family protein [Dyadobacter frigoris]|uniref:Gfo/Idh/MocA family oxidoreductase n=1 Tax=Dyadobacter frigoris TaxID=2576211 RepID=A0A4U6D468_9BACT|nr:Gfo/Idh/MocA family oxidoreductase [Dyadobacter frigoris]TKT90748.1 Gfo/Idh/MocA family oxidoreductase [Dyadobacter frigoris]GLU52082.1 glycosyl hydrolase family 109 protein 1 [Dyadobacter frigoris]